MGRRKIAIEPLTDDRNRTVTFTKRKAGLFKKAHELAILCEIDISVIIIGRNHKVYEYSSSDPNKIIERFQSHRDILQESKRPHDYGKYETKSRILDPNKLKTNNGNRRSNSGISERTLSSNRNQEREYSQSNQIDSDYDSTEDGDDSEAKNDNFETNHHIEKEQYFADEDMGSTADANSTTITSAGVSDTKMNTRKRLRDSSSNSSTKKSKLDEMSDLTPKTPENHYQNQTPMSDANSVAYRTPSVLKNSKGKDSRRPTLSLKIPTMDNDVDKSNGSTITVTNSSSNKSNSINTLNSNKNNKGKKEIRIDERKDVIIPSPVYNVTDSSSEHSANIKMPSMDNSTPLPSALFKDKRIYTPLSTTFMNSLNMIPSAGVSSANADLAQMGYFNFNGMSPTQALTPVFPFTQPHTANKQGNNKQQNSAENQIPQRGSADGIRRGTLLQQFQVQSHKPGPNGYSGQASQPHSQSPKIQLLQHGSQQSDSKSHTQPQSQSQSQSQSQQLSQPFLPPMNSATSIYFPQMRGNSSRPLPPSANTSLSGIELPTLSTIGNNSGTNFQNHASGSNEISGLPSRYVEFQSPTTLFNNQDWNLPTGSTPVLTQPNTNQNFPPKKDGDSISDETILEKPQ